MKKIILLCLILGLVGCGKSAAERKYDEINSRLTIIEIEREKYAKDCNKAVENMQKNHNDGKILEAKNFAKEAEITCGKAKSLAQESMDLSLEAIRLIPLLPDK